ncbi:MAG TPA: CRISPR-associated helicase Cas3' [Methanotrichaceae archaeon]|nr:CRISPR-associated helicase Cas3' [Methanotrichaceae archaeon]
MIQELPEDGTNFAEFFKKATGNDPYPFQKRFAYESLPELIDIPTGLGKTDCVVLGWLWRRRFDPRPEVRAATPRRLVYCLPMRTLVEQTAKKANKWLKSLGMMADVTGCEQTVDGWASEVGDRGERIAVTVLMGGEDANDWDLYPERDAILIGTQDMLLSRALNRGYGMSRYRWPMHFGLLNNDCLWVMDEVQLMGRGLATTTQLEAFRRKMGTAKETKTFWMSATLSPEWLRTIDFQPSTENIQGLNEDDLEEPKVKSRIQAMKILRQATSKADDFKGLAEEILKRHTPGTRTLVVLNTVRRAVELHSAIKKKEPAAELILVHSRFRPPDREKVVEAVVSEPNGEGTIIVSTQVVEAGVDISAKTLFTELAPWSSLVQRFGRCNRSGEYSEAEVYWMDLQTGAKSLAPPYLDEELDEARRVLEGLDQKNVSSSNLPKVPLPFDHIQVIRCKDMLELFDTTPDLAGQGIDISRFIRDTSDTDLQVFWRDLPDEGPGENDPQPHRKELCSVPLSDVRDLVKKGLDAWYWDSFEGIWSPVAKSTPIIPGAVIMLRAADGRYTEEGGWNPKSKKPIPIVPVELKLVGERYSDVGSFANDWETVAEHTESVFKTASTIIELLGINDGYRSSLLEGIRWHDAGKAHSAFQAKIKPEALENFPNRPAAKAPKDAWRKGRLPGHFKEDDGRRKHFRHELASGILALMHGRPDLVAYLAAAHHGKVRVSIRSMPDEYRPWNDIRFARGIWDGDVIPEVDLGAGVKLPATSIDLSYMDLGDGPLGPSWLSRMLSLRDSPDIGPFRLSFLEALIKASDERASRGEA